MKSILMLLQRLLLIFILAQTTACGMTHPGTHQLAIDLAAELKAQVCRVPFRPGDPCGDRNVQAGGLSGIAVYVYVYGVNDQREMQMLVDTATRLRDKRGKPDRRIPVDLTFYADLPKSHSFYQGRLFLHEIKTIKIKGN